MIALYLDGTVNLDASVPDIETGLRGLDGADHSLLVVELPSRATITVGGGPETFAVEVTSTANDHWNVVDLRRLEGTLQLVVGGEVVDLPARFCVDRNAALEAVRTFASENGARSPRLHWSPGP